MKKILIGLIITISLTSCVDEFWFTSETLTSFDDGRVLCTCTEVSSFDDEGFPLGLNKVNDVITEYWYSGKKCEELGYSVVDENNFEILTSPPANSYFRSGSSGSGSIPSYCAAGYKSPTTDVQLNSLCQTAFIYRCSGNKAAADITCAQYKNIEQSSPVVVCPVCN